MTFESQIGRPVGPGATTVGRLRATCHNRGCPRILLSREIQYRRGVRRRIAGPADVEIRLAVRCGAVQHGRRAPLTVRARTEDRP